MYMYMYTSTYVYVGLLPHVRAGPLAEDAGQPGRHLHARLLCLLLSGSGRREHVQVHNPVDPVAQPADIRRRRRQGVHGVDKTNKTTRQPYK